MSSALTTTHRMGLPRPLHALILGGRGGIGGAIVQRLLEAATTSKVTVTSRSLNWCQQEAPSSRLCRLPLDLSQPASINSLGEYLRHDPTPLNLIINCTGVLHGPGIQPERSLKHLSLPQMQEIFAINTFGVALVLQELLPILPRKAPSIFASLSARVGSIGDNHLGGWYSYRASKAAQNMMIRTAAIEGKRSRPQLICVALHPGTVRTPLSAPFTQRRPDSELFTPEQSADHLLKVLDQLSPKDSGQHYAWDGQVIPW